MEQNFIIFPKSFTECMKLIRQQYAKDIAATGF